MRGFPKHINSKRDVDNLIKTHPQEIKAWVDRHLRSMEGWHTVRKVESKADVQETKSVRVKTATIDDGTEELYEEHYGPVPGNAIEKIGLTKEAAEKILG